MREFLRKASGSRFVSLYYVLNGLLFAAFGLLRQRVPPTGFLSIRGTPIAEEQVYLTLFMLCSAKFVNAPTLDAWLGTCILFCQATCLLVLYFIDVRYMIYFAGVFFTIALFVPQPRKKDPANVLTLTSSSVDDILRRKDNSIWIIQVYAAWSPLCTQLAPLFGGMAENYTHSRLYFGKVDVAQWPAAASSLSVDASGGSSELPSYIVIQSGKEARRVPARNGSNSAFMKRLSQGMLEQLLDMPGILRQARKWAPE
ncbi:Thioredoxin-related transmembrane protein 2-A [Porphyridium purpureum]|uniref:Thioredoxin-related transmembrane protein 2-A n=1 Tax=Porphyridium purpureum TaxID=35688 RepID=A0A5J4YSB3_PORPP|nr:Thioredoxin-related transmembrane protein 2-A [Porphyridium purpureum]|eukprot:POR2663..scf236_6